MQSINKYLFLIILLINNCVSFELGLWRGLTHYYVRNSNSIDLSKPLITTNNYTYYYNLNKSLFQTSFIDTRFLRLKLQSYDKLGGVIAKVDKRTDNTYYFTNQINFFYNAARSVITINYTYNNDQKLQLNSIVISGLRCALSRTSNKRFKLLNLSELNDKLKNWTYCKSSIVNPKNPFVINQKEFNCYDYEYLLLNEKRLSYVFADNLIISVPDIIDDNKPFSLLFGCLISPSCYKQVNLNYNFNGVLTSFEFNEYEPYNFTNKINNYLNLMKKKIVTLTPFY